MSRAHAYHILGITHEAGKDEIKRAYRKLALLYHPDRNQSTNAAEKFIEINRAYDMLMSDSFDYQAYIDLLQKQYQRQADADRIYKERLYQILRERDEAMKEQNIKVENDIKFYVLMALVISLMIYTIIKFFFVEK
jgi:DnaJ-class molecular chaperone